MLELLRYMKRGKVPWLAKGRLRPPSKRFALGRDYIGGRHDRADAKAKEEVV